LNFEYIYQIKLMSTLVPLLALGAWNFGVGLFSIRSALGYREYARRAARARSAGPPSRTPSVMLVAPCCGEEAGLEENLEALLNQDYPSFSVRFVVEGAQDGAVPVIRRTLARNPGRGDLVLAGPAAGRSQKVQNLLAAIENPPAAEVLVFADSDGRPERDWLNLLVAPLERAEVGVASSYRFYLPEPATFATLLRSAWNAAALTVLGDHDHNFAWGGAMAIRRDVFDRIGVAEAWRGALSDDYAMTHAVRRAGMRVEFVPSCLVGSRGDISLSGLLSWCGRQLTITRVYWPAFFAIAAATHLLYGAFLALAVVEGNFALMGIVLLPGLIGGGLRAAAIADLAPQWRETIRRHLWAYVLLVPVAGVLTLLGVGRALWSRRIEWRGKLYEMRSPTRTVILGD
jgi:cellulose synthase/poly-beta-1,6-N-acetylglucosamine synthase-like glycosyltransferase